MTDPTPLIVSRFDVAMESAPEEEPVLTIGAIAEDGRPVALRFDVEDRRKVAAWLAPAIVSAEELDDLKRAVLSGDRTAGAPYLAVRDAIARQAEAGERR